MGHQYDNLVGQTFGRYTVLERGPSYEYVSGGRTIKQTRFYCRCECGSISLVIRSNLLRRSRQCWSCHNKDLKWQHVRNREIQLAKFGIIGVSFEKGRYVARIKIDGVTSYIGSFDTVTDAAMAYDARATEKYGANAVTNFKYEPDHGA